MEPDLTGRLVGSDQPGRGTALKISFGVVVASRLETLYGYSANT
jgi:hypothetical protein